MSAWVPPDAKPYGDGENRRLLVLARSKPRFANGAASATEQKTAHQKKDQPVLIS
jgi:hypothetical protein